MIELSIDEIHDKLKINATIAFPNARGILFVARKNGTAQTVAAEEAMDNVSRTFYSDLQFAVIDTIDLPSPSEMQNFLKAVTSFEYPSSIDFIVVLTTMAMSMAEFTSYFGDQAKRPQCKKFIFFFISAELSFDWSFVSFNDCIFAHIGCWYFENEFMWSDWSSMLCKNLKLKMELTEVLAKTHVDVLEVKADILTKFWSACDPVYLNGMLV